MEGLPELESRQLRILGRIADLEACLLPHSFSAALSLSSSSSSSSSVHLNNNDDDKNILDHGATAARLSSILCGNGVRDFQFNRVPSDYYDLPLEARRDILGAASVEHLCKSIVLVNTQSQSDVTDCSDHNNSKYYVVVVQYTARFSAETVKNFLYALNNGKVAKKKFNLRLAPEELSHQLTGYGHNAVTCVGMKTDIPVILDEAIAKLSPDFFWLGGGETDLKLGIRTSEFIDFAKPFIVSCSSN